MTFLSNVPELAQTPVPPIELRDVSKTFSRREDVIDRMVRKVTRQAPPPVVRAVDNVSLHVKKGEILALVGESGCGKSTLGRMVAGISRPTFGQVMLDGLDRESLRGQAAVVARLKVQMVFQDPFSSLNPRMRVQSILEEAAVTHGIVARGGEVSFVEDQLRRVELDPAYRHRFPHQFSGGQRQRIGIARALSVNPQFLVCDESVAALDVSIQAQILNLFMAIRRELDISYLFITHDLGVVEHIADRVAIMYLGRLVEEAPAEEIFARPNHPYSQALLSERPRLDTTRRFYTPIKGDIPSPLSPPSGCHFHTRCPHVLDICRQKAPVFRHVAANHSSACHLNDQR